jgi:hypothetical protein
MNRICLTFVLCWNRHLKEGKKKNVLSLALLPKDLIRLLVSHIRNALILLLREEVQMDLWTHPPEKFRSTSMNASYYRGADVVIVNCPAEEEFMKHYLNQCGRYARDDVAIVFAAVNVELTDAMKDFSEETGIALVQINTETREGMERVLELVVIGRREQLKARQERKREEDEEKRERERLMEPKPKPNCIIN